MPDKDTLMLILSSLFAVLWWLLRQKDAAQAKQIDLLFQKHDEDAKALQELRVEIAKTHYVKDELDAKFERLEGAFRDGFSQLGQKFDRLSEALTAHISKEQR